MTLIPHKFTFKIIVSYIVLLVMAVAVSYFLYSEFREYTNTNSEDSVENKFIETGTLINLVYETDSFSRLALLTGKESDFKSYGEKSDSLFQKLEEIKELTAGVNQEQRLDSVKELLTQKNKNIDQLRVLKLTSSKDNSLDEILDEFKKLEVSMGKNSLETLLRNPSKLSDKQRRVWQSFADWLNTTTLTDTTKLNVVTVDSMLVASRFIVSEAKRENSRINRSLKQKENDLIINDLTISAQLRGIVAAFDAELTKNQYMEKVTREAKIERTRRFLRYAAIVAALVMLLFVYIILNDFFKAERFKKSLEKSKVLTEDLLKSREQLISTVSHDLKTPLNTIVGYSELIENTGLEDRQKYYVDQITSSANFVTKLVDDLLDYSKLEAGQLRLEHIPFSLESLVSQVGEGMKDIHNHKNIDLRIDIESRLQGAIFKNDPFRIQQIVNNLVGNAYKFTDSGSIKISALVQKETKTAVTVGIVIEDSGIGITKEKQEAIFKEFTQADKEIAHKFGGSGLGLAISKKLSQLLGGDISVESALGEGSIFTFTLPLEKTMRSVVEVVKSEVSELGTLSILVFDDNPAMLSLLSEIFEQMEVECHPFTAFSDFKKSSSLEFNCVLTDIQMPEASGFEVLSKIKNGVDYTEAKIPVIAMTGSREYPEAYYLEQGFDKMLPKPFSKGALVNALNELFPKVILEIEDHKSFSSKNNDLFDLTLLRSFLSDETSLREILKTFYQETENDLEALEEMISKRTYSEINAKAHKMLTMARQIEANRVIPILETLEVSTVEVQVENDLDVTWVNLKLELTSLLDSLKRTVH